MQVSEYKKLLNNNITAKYKIAGNQVINKEAKQSRPTWNSTNASSNTQTKAPLSQSRTTNPTFPTTSNAA